MTPTVYAARITGLSADALTLHSSYEGAVSGLLTRGAMLYRGRFEYVPRELAPKSPAALRDLPPGSVSHVLHSAMDRLQGGGWCARIEELPVELDGPAEEPVLLNDERPGGLR